MMERYEVILEATGDGLILLDTQFPIEEGRIKAEVAEFSDTDTGLRVCACLNALSGIPDPAAFVEAAKGWKNALEKIAQHKEPSYGFFHGGDPRDFSPDSENSTDEEKAAHDEACRAFDEADKKGEPLPPMRCKSGPSPCGGHVLRSQFGLGVSHHPSPCALVAQDALSGKVVE